MLLPKLTVWQTVILISLGLHGLVLALPIPQKADQALKPIPKPKTVRITQLNLLRIPKPIARSPQKLPSQQPTTAIARPTLERSVSMPPLRQNSLSPLKSAKTKPSPQPTPVESSSNNLDRLTSISSPSSNSPPVALGISEISGVPVDATWQTVDQPAKLLANPNFLTQANGQPHADIVGPVAQVPRKAPELLFKEFFSENLPGAQFYIEPIATYADGGKLYKLQRDDLPAPLYLTLLPTKDGAGTVMTIWKQQPKFT